MVSLAQSAGSASNNAGGPVESALESFLVQTNVIAFHRTRGDPRIRKKQRKQKLCILPKVTNISSTSTSSWFRNPATNPTSWRTSKASLNKKNISDDPCDSSLELKLSFWTEKAAEKQKSLISGGAHFRRRRWLRWRHQQHQRRLWHQRQRQQRQRQRHWQVL